MLTKAALVVFALAVPCYVVAIIFMESDVGEILSDFANAFMLLACVLLLLGLHRRLDAIEGRGGREG